MKRVLTFILVIVMALSLAACGKSETPETGAGDAPPTGAQNDANAPPTGAQNDAGVPLEDNVISFRPVTAVDDAQLTFAIESFDPGDDQRWPAFHCRIENKTDAVIYLDLQFEAVNGIAVEPRFYCDDGTTSNFGDIQPGATEPFILEFDARVLKACGIPYIEQLDFQLAISAPYLSEKYVYTPCFEAYQESVSVLVDNTTTVPSISDAVPGGDEPPQVLFDTAGVKMTLLGDCKDGAPLGPSSYFCRWVCFENNTAQNLTFRISEVAVDGYACNTELMRASGVSSGIFFTPVRAGSKAYIILTVGTADWSEANRSATNADITLRVDDGASFMRGNNALLEGSFPFTLS